MDKKFYKNEKFQNWFFPLLYLALAVAVVITGCLTFKKLYYQPIVVTGSSMWPTLSGGGYYESFVPEGESEQVSAVSRNHYGLADLHRSSVNELKRFDVVVTYYPQAWGTDGDEEHYLQNRTYKIKRVWGFPGEIINLTFNQETMAYTFTALKRGQEDFRITSSPVKTIKQTYQFKNVSEDKFYDREVEFEVNEFSLSEKSFYVSYKVPDKQTSSTRTIYTKALKDDEYFVMGDNWQGSTDSYNHSSSVRLTKEYLQGRVICINSYTTYSGGNTLYTTPTTERYWF